MSTFERAQPKSLTAFKTSKSTTIEIEVKAKIAVNGRRHLSKQALRQYDGELGVRHSILGNNFDFSHILLQV